jgi:hypothetical protein
MKALDLEWIIANWENATEDDRLAAGKEMRKQFRAGMTMCEGLARDIAPWRGDPKTIAGRIEELRRQGLSLQQVAAVIKQENAHLPAWQMADAPRMRAELREALDSATTAARWWAAMCPRLEPAWGEIQQRAMNLHERLRRDDLEVKE